MFMLGGGKIGIIGSGRWVDDCFMMEMRSVNLKLLE